MNALRAVVHSREEPFGDIPFVGREIEALRLRDAILKRESLLIAGPAGIGKTSLVLKVLGGLPPATTRNCFYLTGEEGVQPLLRCLLQQLYQLEDVTLRRQLHVEGIRENTFKSWLKQQRTEPAQGSRLSVHGRKQLLGLHRPVSSP